MKRYISAFLILTYSICNLPSYALSSTSAVIPVIGPGFEKVHDKANELIDLAPIKLPEKIKNFELIEAERYLAPNVLKDQVGLWTSPFRMKYKDLVWLIPAGGIITALLLTDDDFTQVLSNNNNPTSIQKDISQGFYSISSAPVIVGLPGFLFLTGVIKKNNRLRETGILQYEAGLNALIVGLVLQTIFGRTEPDFRRKKDRGEFFKEHNSFPSGHAFFSFSLASVAAHQYPDKKWVAPLAYILSGIASSARVTANKHFVSDVAVGALVGYLIGKYVVEHRSKFAPKKEKKERLRKPGELSKI